MSLEFSCPQCSATLAVPEHMAGTLIRCGECSTLLRVPTESYRIAERVREDGASPPAAARPASGPEPYPTPSQEPPPASPPADSLSPPPAPPSSQGRGVLFWIVMVLLGLSVGSCLCCCLIFAVMPEPSWQLYTSRDGWFQVELPSSPRVFPLAPPFAAPNSQVEGATLDKYGEEYRVIHWNVPPLQRLVRNDEALMQRALDQLLADLRHSQLLQPPRPVPGQPHLTYELEWLDKGNRRHIARLVLAGDRFYLLLVQARFFWTEPDPERVERFFQSFRVLRLGGAEAPGPDPKGGFPKKNKVPPERKRD
ncbi:MAG: hypothetical protein NZU63_04905 [Gemmataceae bacterium]|nr:hypothetical protein [Gemmataceae bacterium]MDW8242452.1 hypothetical protein [Thermogemmata sp.]